jgi:transcriptional regulator with XRE-family HTH domain
MTYLISNIKYLRALHNLTQNQLANKLGIKRSLLGAIEESRTEPRASILHDLSKFFKVPMNYLINTNLKEQDPELLNINKNIDELGKHIRTHQIVVSEKDLDRELISLVPISARAGYSTGIVQPSYIEELPKFNLPFNEIKRFGTYRVFQIAGDSMLPIVKPNDYLIAEYIDNWRVIKDLATYIIITQTDGILYKRISRRNDRLTLISENKEYESFEIEVGEIIELWKPIGLITFQLDEKLQDNE